MEDPTTRSVLHGAITTLCSHPIPVTPLTPRRGTCLSCAERRRRCATPLRGRTLPAHATARLLTAIRAAWARRIRNEFPPPPTVEWRFHLQRGGPNKAAARHVAPI